MPFFLPSDLLHITEGALKELSTNYAETHLLELISRKEELAFSYVKNAGYDTKQIKLQRGDDRDKIIIEIIDLLVCSALFIAKDGQDPDISAVHSKVQQNAMKRLEEIAKGNSVISTTPEKPENIKGNTRTASVAKNRDSDFYI